MKKKDFLISLIIYIPLGVILSYINYKSSEISALAKALVFGFIGALFVFFIPNFNKKSK